MFVCLNTFQGLYIKLGLLSKQKLFNFITDTLLFSNCSLNRPDLSFCQELRLATHEYTFVVHVFKITGWCMCLQKVLVLLIMKENFIRWKPIVFLMFFVKQSCKAQNS